MGPMIPSTNWVFEDDPNWIEIMQTYNGTGFLVLSWISKWEIRTGFVLVCDGPNNQELRFPSLLDSAARHVWLLLIGLSMQQENLIALCQSVMSWWTADAVTNCCLTPHPSVRKGVQILYLQKNLPTQINRMSTIKHVNFESVGCN
jgi:hypothetical protein